MNQDDYDLGEEDAESPDLLDITHNIKSRFITWLTNLANATDDVYRIEYIEQKETFIMQTESKRQFKVTIEPINSYKESPWNC